jgi:hypothetical protein
VSQELDLRRGVGQVEEVRVLPLLVPLLLALLVACGATPAPVATAREPAPTARPAPPPARPGAIDRDVLDEILAAGIGRFLRRVETEPHLDGGAFVGFRVLRLRSSLFEGVDLRPGDTVLGVNGLPLERPEHAMAIWSALRVASELTVELLRAGEPMQLRYAIEAPPPVTAAASPRR